MYIEVLCHAVMPCSTVWHLTLKPESYPVYPNAKHSVTLYSE